MTIFVSAGRFLGIAYGRARRWIRGGDLWVRGKGWTRKGVAKTAGLTVLALFLIPLLHGLFDIRMVHKQPSMHLLDRSYGFIAAIENDEREFGHWKMPDTLPRLLIMTTLAAEDRRFADHSGVDLRAVGGALVNNYVHGRSQRGASTLAMQVARLQHGGTSGWYWKLHDAVVATGITVFFGRDQVLAQYFRIAPYGNRIAGAACASRRYFHKPVQDLSLAECALLASLPKAPSRFNLFSSNGMDLAKRRAAMVLERCVSYGWVPKSVVDGALSELSTLSVPQLEHREESSFHFLAQCAKKLGVSPTGEIRTTLDRAVQDTLFDIFRRNIPYLHGWEANNTAAIVLDAKTGEVLGYLGSVDYANNNGGAIDCASLPRSTGSLLKPFIYGLGMEWQGYTAANILTDLDFDFGSGGNSFVPENSDRKYQGPVLYKNALANSRNIPAVQVLKSVGVELFYRHCIALGLANDDGKAEYYGLGLSIGGLYSSLQQIAGAYLTLANEGVRKDLVWEMPASNHASSGDDATNSVATPVQAIPSDIAMQIRRFLSDPVARLPTFPRGGNLEYPFAVAAKTGTSEGFRDSWCVAFSDRYLVAVWVGNVDFTPTKNLTGYMGAASLVKNVMYALHPDRTDGQRDVEFPPPPGFAPVPICKLSGKRADRLTPFVTTEYFRPGTEPVEISDVNQLLPIDKSNGLLALPPCPVAVEYRRFTVLDPQYADWAKAQGLEVPPERLSPACGESSTVDAYAVSITSPRHGSRFFLDPEMPPDRSILPLHVKIFPPPASVLWMVNDQEYKVVQHPFTLQLPMTPGAYTVQAVVPGTEFKSQAVKFEVY
ncbi:MAG: transglycosylase domain-containing protein [Fibrobacterota bacterium]